METRTPHKGLCSPCDKPQSKFYSHCQSIGPKSQQNGELFRGPLIHCRPDQCTCRSKG